MRLGHVESNKRWSESKTIPHLGLEMAMTTRKEKEKYQKMLMKSREEMNDNKRHRMKWTEFSEIKERKSRKMQGNRKYLS